MNIKNTASKIAVKAIKTTTKLSNKVARKSKQDSNVVGVKRLNDAKFKLHWVRLRDDSPYRYHGQGGKLKYQIVYSGFCQPPFIAYQLDKKGNELSCKEFRSLESAAAYCDKLRAKEK